MRILTEQKLVKYLKSEESKKQNEAFITLYRKCFQSVKKYITQNNGDENAAEDVFQDSYLILLRQLQKPGFQINRSISNYLQGICRNLWLQELRHKKSSGVQSKEDLEYIAIIEDQVPLYEINERNQIIISLLENLNEDCRKIIELFYYHEMRMAQIYEVMGYSSEQVAKNKKSSCLKKLRDNVRSNSDYRDSLR